MEIGDVFVINKPIARASANAKELEARLSLAAPPRHVESALVKTVATDKKGSANLATALESISS